MKKETRFKFGLREKMTVIFILFGAVILVMTILDIRRMIREIYKEYYNEALSDIAETVEKHLETLGIGAEEIRAYVRSGMTDPRYDQALAEMQEIRERFELESLYIMYPTGKNTAVWFANTSGEDAHSLGNRVKGYADDALRDAREVYHSGEASGEMDWTPIVNENESGTEDENDGMDGVEDGEKGKQVISVYYPINDAYGNCVAVLGADKTELEMVEKIKSSLAGVIHRIVPIVTAATALLILFVQMQIVLPIRRLKHAVQKFGEGESGMRFPDGRRDELGEIARTFNRMADSIGRHIGEMEELNHAYQKLLPPGIFEMLHKKSIVEFHLGDQKNVDLTVLAMEPDGAARVMPELSSRQTFQYINDILAQTVPAVIEQGGAAWKFDRAGVYSFFQGSAKDALEAALLAGKRLQKIEERVAAGIMKGQVMVGVAGHEARMEVISISEQTRIAELFMRIGRQYHASILVGRSAASEIPDFSERYHVRFLGYLKLSSPERLEGVYDVFDGDEDAERGRKQRTRKDFERGVRLFTQQDHRGAREAFIDVLRQYRGDDASREYLELCNRVLEGKECEDRVWFAELRGASL